MLRKIKMIYFALGAAIGIVSQCIATGYEWGREEFLRESDMNYAVMRDILGDIWVGKTKLEPNNIGVFADWDDAVQAAFDTRPSEDNRCELGVSREEDTETIRKDMEKWIVI